MQPFVHDCSSLAVLVDKHPVGILLLSNTVKGTRFSVNKIHWHGCLRTREQYARLPERVIGEIASWDLGRREDQRQDYGRLGVGWPPVR